MQPAYLALLRTIVAESRSHPELAELFRSAAPPLASAAIVELLIAAREEGSVVVDDLDGAARLFVGPLLTFALLDGLFMADGDPRPPEPAQVERQVELYSGSSPPRRSERAQRERRMAHTRPPTRRNRAGTATTVRNRA